ncbi:MAG: hypothetical protein ACWIPJ_10940, partial [Polaribacter sp.]
MKKLLYMLSIFVMLFSCSSNDDDNDASNTSCVNPPDWLIGTWIHYSNDGEFEENKYIVSQDNIISFDYDISTDWQVADCDNVIDNSILTIEIEEFYTSEYYLFRKTQTTGGTTIPFNRYFFKIDNNTMNYS